MVMMQITQQSKEKLADCTEKILHYAGKLMQCVEEMEEPDGEMNQRQSYRHMDMREDVYRPYDDERRYGDRMDYYGDRRGTRMYR